VNPELSPQGSIQAEGPPHSFACEIHAIDQTRSVLLARWINVCIWIDLNRETAAVRRSESSPQWMPRLNAHAAARCIALVLRNRKTLSGVQEIPRIAVEKNTAGDGLVRYQETARL